MTSDASPDSPPSEANPTAPEERPAPDRVVVEDTASADVGDAAANAATDALIDQAESDPVVPGEPADAHRS